MVKKLPSAANYRASLHFANGGTSSCSMDGNSGGGGDCSSNNRKKVKLENDLDNGAVDVKEEMKGEEITPPCSSAVKRCEEEVGEKRKRVDFMDSTAADEMFGGCSKRRVMLDQAGNSSSLKIEKKEGCGLAPMVRCSQIGRTSENRIQKVENEQDIHLGEGFEGLRESQRKSVLDLAVLPDTTNNQAPSEIEEVFMLEQTGLPTRTDDSSCLTLEKKEVSGLVVRCSQIGNTSGSCVQEVETYEQDIHLGDGLEDLLASLRNRILEQPTDGSPSTAISKNITLVKTIHSKRMEELIANQSKISKQFREARDIIEVESIANIRQEFLHNSALVRKIHSETEVRIVKLKAVGDEFTRKLKIIKNHLNAEQEKLNSVHRAVREEEEELKNRWLQAAKYGRPVHAFSILPQFVNSSFNLEDLKLCANLPSETLLLSSSINDASVLPHAMQLELKSNISEGDIPLAVQIQRLLPTDEPSEPGTGGHVSENSLFCQQVKEENHGQIVKFDEELARNRRIDQAQPVEFHDEFKMRMQPINTDFEKVMEDHSQKYSKEMEYIHQECSKLINNLDHAFAQKKEEIDTSVDKSC